MNIFTKIQHLFGIKKEPETQSVVLTVPKFPVDIHKFQVYICKCKFEMTISDGKKEFKTIFNKDDVIDIVSKDQMIEIILENNMGSESGLFVSDAELSSHISCGNLVFHHMYPMNYDVLTVKKPLTIKDLKGKDMNLDIGGTLTPMIKRDKVYSCVYNYMGKQIGYKLSGETLNKLLTNEILIKEK